jgi:hypothetical protein
MPFMTHRAFPGKKRENGPIIVIFKVFIKITNL